MALLSSREVEELARYNAEVARGIVHTTEWKAKMAEQQRRFENEHDPLGSSIPLTLIAINRPWDF